MSLRDTNSIVTDVFSLALQRKSGYFLMKYAELWLLIDCDFIVMMGSVATRATNITLHSIG
jgi:hypothetical protein